jgi:uncharacterized protein (TIGR00156 family)
MNKITQVLFALTLTLTTVFSYAAFQPTGESKSSGGFQGPTARHLIHDVVSALNASDDAQIELTGNIISSIGHDDYIFRDATGEIKVEIDDNLWQGNTVTPETQVIIRGEVDKNWSEVTIDADHIQVVQ